MILTQSKYYNRCAPGNRGFTYMEILISSLIIGICLAGMVSLWYFSYRLSQKTDQYGIAYSVGREAMERSKKLGFQYTPTGSSSLYYDSNGGSESTSQLAVHTFKALTTATAGTVGAGTDGLLLVEVEVFLLSTNVSLYKTSTYFVEGGI